MPRCKVKNSICHFVTGSKHLRHKVTDLTIFLHFDEVFHFDATVKELLTSFITNVMKALEDEEEVTAC